MSQPVDHASRTLALSPSDSFIVQAPAGSGKTELLTRRVLTLLCNVDEPEDILAITFTRKAASEMRQRVISTLINAELNPHAADEYEREGIELAQQVLERDKQFGWQLTRNPQRLNLRTIDALATKLAHQLPITSTLGAPTGTMDKAEVFYKEAARRFIESNLESIDLLLLQLGNKLDKAVGLLAGLLAKRDQWRRYVLHADADHEQLRELLESMLADLIESRLQKLCSLMPSSVKQAVTVHLPRAAEFSLALADGDQSELPWQIQSWINMDAVPEANLSDLNQWVAIAHGLLTVAGGLRKTVSRKEGFPTSAADAKQIGIGVPELKEHKQAMIDVLESLVDETEFCALLKETTGLPQPVYGDEQWALLSQLLTVLPELLRELDFVFAEAAMVDFGEISKRAELALGDEENPTDLALAMDLSLKHLLVDEFQDTSQSQFRLFEKLLSQWQPGDGRTFFAVGDPMQSIYRFREGDVALFTQVQEHGIADIEVKPLTLSVNFRSSPAVIDWVNTSFGQIFPERADIDSGAITFAESTAHRDYAGHVEIHPLVNTDKLAEAETVAGICSQAIADDAEHSVAILVRSRAQAHDIFAALRSHNLSYASIDMDPLGERPVVRDLITLVMALRYPHDRLHWLALLRAPFIGLTLHDLHGLLDGVDARTAVVECLNDKPRIEQLSEDAQHRIKRLLGVLTPALLNRERGRLMPWVESTWLQLGGPVVCEDALDKDAAERALVLLSKLEQQGQLWQKNAIEAAMAGLFASSTDSSQCQIQVMTLHKSKGLEFDTVILPALDRKPRGNTTQLINWFEGSFGGEPKLLLAPFEQSGVPKYNKDKLIKLVKRADERCEEQEKLRLLYVACTRAKKHLHLVARAAVNTKNDVSAPIKSSLLAPLWKLLENDFLAVHQRNQQTQQTPTDPELNDDSASEQQLHDNNTQLKDQLQIVETKAPAFRRLPINTTLPTLAPFGLLGAGVQEPKPKQESIEYAWASNDARSIGTVVHEQLQLMAQQGLDKQHLESDACTALVERQLMNLGVNPSGLMAATKQVLLALNNTLEDETGRWILHEHKLARNEWALTVPMVAKADEHADVGKCHRVVIDRTFVDEHDVRWIIDYKTGDHQGGHLEAFLSSEQDRYADQLNRYADIMSRIDQREVKVGLYFPMLKAFRHWQPDVERSLTT